MEYAKAARLLALLYPEAGREKEALLELFRQAVLQIGSCRELSKYLQTTEFWGVEGKELYTEGNAAIERALADIGNYEENVRGMASVVRSIEKELQRTEEVLEGAVPLAGGVSLVKSVEVPVYTALFKALINAVCWYLAAMRGAQALEGISFNPRAGFAELLQILGEEIMPRLGEKYVSASSWVIRPVRYSGGNMIQFDGFQIEYSSRPLSRLVEERIGEYAERVGPFFYLDTGNDGPVFVGSGNLMGILPGEGLSLLEASVTTRIPAGFFGSGELNLKNLSAEITNFLGAKYWCISPENIVAALNRWCMARSVRARREAGLCAFCGSPAQPGEISCDAHIAVGQR